MVRDRVVFDARGLVPAILQHAESGEVLMMAWMNREALRLTRETGQAHFWSRSRETLWHKGATSGNFMNVREIRVDCDGDTLLVCVDPEGPACHTGERSCFYRRLGDLSADAPDGVQTSQGAEDRMEPDQQSDQPGSSRAEQPSGVGEPHILDELFAVILDRRTRRPRGSYTVQLFEAGEDEILKKVGEEAMEVVLAAKGQGDGRMVAEIADLAYHLLVLLASRGLAPADVEAELAQRRR